jgi:hypothetical protein
MSRFPLLSSRLPSQPGYNGGCCKVMRAFGITSQLTNSATAVAATQTSVSA